MISKELYTIKHIRNLTDLIKYEKYLPKVKEHARWIFRGQRCHTAKNDFDLMPSLERMARSFELSPNVLPCIECWSLREFKRRLHQYTTDVPAEEDRLEWLALMQHYGAPTRLLDWTYSFFVAVYFAIESFDTCDCEVWALNANYFSTDERMDSQNGDSEIRELITCPNDPTSKATDRSIILQNKFLEHIWTKPSPCVCQVNPLRLNDRLTIQQGVFLIPGDITQPFEVNLSAKQYESESKQNLVKFKIKSKLRREILSWLYQFNITQATLFPGLDGFARSFNTRLAFLPEITAELRCREVRSDGSAEICCSRSMP